MFLRTTRPVEVPSAVVAAGPFGDAKNYNGRDLYLSWYATGLLAEGRGPLDDARSTLHRRDRVGIRREGQYVSVDTGTYSMAPWLAHTIADDLL